MNNSNKININSLIVVRDFLKNGLSTNSFSKYEEAGKIKSFEICFEMSWKILKKILGMRGLEVLSPKETFRNAEIEGLIESSEDWFSYADKRNLTIHTYNGVFALETVTGLPKFLEMMNSLVNKLKKCEECYYDSNR